MSTIYYVSGEKLYTVSEKGNRELKSLTIENYIQTAKEIAERRNWKASGTGASFMGITLERRGDDKVATGVESVVCAGERLIYAASLETSCGLYTKNPRDDKEPEGFITRKLNTRFFEVDYHEGGLVLSANEGGRERHLALCGEDRPNFRMITEGECADITPSFSRSVPGEILFSSAGYYVDSAKNKRVYDTYNLCRLDIGSGEITEVLNSPACDFLRPKDRPDGKLYCLRRPKEEPKSGTTFVDVLLVPFRMLKALFGWMNFFSQRYSGEPLVKRSGGDNPGKHQEKDEEQLFVEGNLINASQTLKENQLGGEQFPGIIPKSWELVQVKPNGDLEVVKRGVADYAFDGEDILYSNGKYIIRLSADGTEEKLCEAKLATSIAVG